MPYAVNSSTEDVVIELGETSSGGTSCEWLQGSNATGICRETGRETELEWTEISDEVCMSDKCVDFDKSVAPLVIDVIDGIAVGLEKQEGIRFGKPDLFLPDV